MPSLITSLFLLSGAFLQVSPELSSAIQAVEADEKVKVSARLGREAAGLVADPSRSLSSERLDALITIALKGRAQIPLGKALINRVVRERNLVTAGLAAKAIAGLDTKVRLRLLRSPPKGWSERLRVLARGDDRDAAKAAAILIGQVATPDTLRRLLRRWLNDEERGGLAVALLAQAGQYPDALAAYEVLARLQPNRDAGARALAAAVTNLVERDADVAAAAVKGAGGGASSAVVRALGAIYEPDLVKRASRMVVSLADADDERVAAAALRSGAELLVTDVEPIARDLAVDTAAAARVRRAAVWALSRLAYKDGPTIDLLIRLLDDRTVAAAAQEALVFKTGVKLRGTPDVWKQWRRSAKLPEPPADLDEHLAQARKLRLRFGKAKARAAKRAAAKRRARAKSKTGAP